MFLKISMSTILNAFEAVLRGAPTHGGGGGREQGSEKKHTTAERERLKENPAYFIFLRRKVDLRDVERVGISYDLVCTLRQKLIYNRRHPVSGLHRKILKRENHCFWIVSTPECVKAVRPWDTIES